MTKETGSREQLRKMMEDKAPSDQTGIKKLAALLSDPKMDGQVFMVPLHYIALTDNIRGAVIKDDEYYAQLENIREYGLLQPLVVQAVDDVPTLIAGYRRHAMLTELGITHARVTSKDPKLNGRLMQIFENIHRSNLPPIRFCEAVKEIHAEFPNDTMVELAKRIGLKDRGRVSFLLKIADWPDDIKNRAMLNTMSLRALIQIARRRESNDPEKLLQMIVVASENRTEEGEKAAATEAAPDDAKIRSRIDNFLTTMPEPLVRHRKDFTKIATRFAGMQPETRAALLEMLSAINSEDDQNGL